MESIKNLEIPKDDSRCAHILRTVIRNLKERERENESRSASSSSSNQGYPNQVYALRQKMFERYLPYPSTKTESRSAASTVTSNPISTAQGPNKSYELRKVLFGRYSK
jgi:hypothetical protein